MAHTLLTDFTHAAAVKIKSPKDSHAKCLMIFESVSTLLPKTTVTSVCYFSPLTKIAGKKNIQSKDVKDM